jgi:hypothetical protein
MPRLVEDAALFTAALAVGVALSWLAWGAYEWVRFVVGEIW